MTAQAHRADPARPRSPVRPPPPGQQTTRADLARAGVALASGMALVAHIVLGLPLVLLWLAAVGCGGALVWLLAAGDGEAAVGDGRVMAAGLRAGVAATVAYDLSRLALVAWGGLPVGPFEALPHFGAALVGAGAPGWLGWAAGAGFHAVNGVGFGLAYTLLFGRRGVAAGVLWGLGLEAAMIALYPAWLAIAELEALVTVSAVGHVSYGATLGVVARRLLARTSDHEGRT